jgi:hypothetical protein
MNVVASSIPAAPRSSGRSCAPSTGGSTCAHPLTTGALVSSSDRSTGDQPGTPGRATSSPERSTGRHGGAPDRPASSPERATGGQTGGPGRGAGSTSGRFHPAISPPAAGRRGISVSSRNAAAGGTASSDAGSSTDRGDAHGSAGRRSDGAHGVDTGGNAPPADAPVSDTAALEPIAPEPSAPAAGTPPVDPGSACVGGAANREDRCAGGAAGASNRSDAEPEDSPSAVGSVKPVGPAAPSDADGGTRRAAEPVDRPADPADVDGAEGAGGVTKSAEPADTGGARGAGGGARPAGSTGGVWAGSTGGCGAQRGALDSGSSGSRNRSTRGRRFGGWNSDAPPGLTATPNGGSGTCGTRRGNGGTEEPAAEGAGAAGDTAAAPWLVTSPAPIPASPSPGTR